MIHFITIPLIIFLSYIVYATYFKDWAKKHWESGGKWAPFMPEDERSFIRVFKVVVIITLIFIITLYILILTGAIGK
jgi:hypothetical protein